MKKSIVVMVAVLTAGLTISAAIAGPGKKVESRTLNQSEEERYVVVTGSYIPQKVKMKSIGTDSIHNVRIYTKSELESTGRIPSVAGGLSIDPSVRISGGGR